MNVVISILNEPSIMLGVVAFVGPMLQKKSLTKVFEGTLKIVVRFLIFSLGGSTIIGVLKSFSTLFQVGLHIDGVVVTPEAAVALAKENYGYVVSATFIVAFVANLLFARLIRFKNIVFLTSIQFMFGVIFTLIIRSHGYSDTAAILVGDIFVGFVFAFLPELCQPFVRKITGSSDMATGHFNMYAYILSGHIGKPSSKYESESTEDLKLPGWLSLFKDFTLGMPVIMLILLYIASFAAGQQTAQEMAGPVHRIVWSFIQAVTSTAGMNVLMYGIRTSLAEITAAFISIFRKAIPNTRPTLDCPTLFPYTPTSVMLGFPSAYIVSLMTAFVVASTSMPAVFIPTANVCFFLGGTTGVFGNSTGGRRGTIAGSLVTGLLLSFLPLMVYPVLTGMRVAQSVFPAVDYNMVSITIHGVLTLVGKIF